MTWITPLLALMFTSGSTGRIVLPALSLIDRLGFVTMYWPFSISTILRRALVEDAVREAAPVGHVIGEDVEHRRLRQ